MTDNEYGIGLVSSLLVGSAGLLLLPGLSQHHPRVFYPFLVLEGFLILLVPITAFLVGVEMSNRTKVICGISASYIWTAMAAAWIDYADPRLMDRDGLNPAGDCEMSDLSNGGQTHTRHPFESYSIISWENNEAGCVSAYRVAETLENTRINVPSAPPANENPDNSDNGSASTLVAGASSQNLPENPPGYPGPPPDSPNRDPPAYNDVVFNDTSDQQQENNGQVEIANDIDDGYAPSEVESEAPSYASTLPPGHLRIQDNTT